MNFGKNKKNRLYHQLSELKKRRKRAVQLISAVVACTARIYDAAMGKAYEARAAFDRATEVASEACAAPDSRPLF